jgi:hypothetical protein
MWCSEKHEKGKGIRDRSFLNAYSESCTKLKAKHNFQSVGG